MIYGSDMADDEFDEVNSDHIAAAESQDRMDARLGRIAGMQFSRYLQIQLEGCTLKRAH